MMLVGTVLQFLGSSSQSAPRSINMAAMSYKFQQGSQSPD